MSNNVVLLLDEQDSRRSLHAFGLRCAGFVVQEAADVGYAQQRIAEHCPGLVLIVRSRLDGAARAFIVSLRAEAYTRDLPVVLAVEHASRADAAGVYECGANDLLFGAITPEDLVVRVRAGLRCAESHTPAPGIDGLMIDACAVRRGELVAALRPAEKRLLQFMVGHPNEVIPRELLLFRVWGGGAKQDSRVVDVTVCRLRRALAELGCGGLLQTVNRHGYKLDARTPPREMGTFIISAAK